MMIGLALRECSYQELRIIPEYRDAVLASDISGSSLGTRLPDASQIAAAAREAYTRSDVHRFPMCPKVSLVIPMVCCMQVLDARA
jgi:hypothetical protein